MMSFPIIPLIVASALSLILVLLLPVESDPKKTQAKTILKYRYGPQLIVALEWVIVFYGLALRFMRYFSNPLPLRDCITRCLAISQYSFSELLKFGHSIKILVHDPCGILFIQKAIIALFGDTEKAIQFFPFFCSIVSLLLFRKIKNWFVRPCAGVLALGLFAASPMLVQYTIIVNAYSSDVCVILLLYFLFRRMQHAVFNRRNVILFSLAGAASVWFSLPAIFILGGAMISFTLEGLGAKERKRLIPFSGIFICWLLSFGIYYFYSIRFFTNLPGLIREWELYMMPQTMNIGNIFKWLVERFYEMFVDLLGLFPFVGIIFFFFGLWDAFGRQRLKASLLFLPFILMLGACAFQKYPFFKRVLLFLVPSFYLLVAQGWEYLAWKERRSYKPVFAFVLGAVILFSPIRSSFFYLFLRPAISSFEESLSIIEEGFQEGDVVYIHNYFGRYFLYYKKRHGLEGKPYVIGSYCKELTCHSDMQQLMPYKRVWYVTDVALGTELNYVLQQLNRMGKCVYARRRKSHCYLYELSK